MLETDLTERLKEALHDRYIVDREIGRGGMATVHLARERHPNRQVAIKVLDPEFATSIARERFLREVEFSSQLTHPNIVPIFNAGQSDDLLYFVMPYIEGHTLRVRLAREGKIGLEETTQIISEIGDALHYAHSKGVIHRDVKPENILLSNGHAVVADFGIARALCFSCEDGITIAGAPIGTPAYMSPEQGSGDEVDVRTDVYSLGALMYEMLTGVAPFPGPTMAAIIAARYTQPTPTLRAAGWTLSATIDAAVERAMQLDRDDRQATTEEFVRAIKPRLTPDNVVIPDTLPAFAATQNDKQRPEGPSIAVLPFANLSADPDNEFFSDGIIEDIITQLSKVDALRVTSRTSVAKYKGADKTLRQIGAELGVKHVLEGSVRKAGNRVRVSVQLIDVGTDTHIWAERFDRELTDIFTIQDEIAAHITKALKTSLTVGLQQEHAQKRTDNIEAYTLYLRGRAAWEKFTPTGIHSSIELYEQAIDVDPSYAMPYAGLADSYSLLTSTLTLLPPNEGMPKAKEAAEKAIALDPNLADAHATLGSVRDFYDWDWKAAAESAQKAIELEPESEKALVMYAFHLSAHGKHEAALRVGRKAVELCVASTMAVSTLGFLHYKARDFDAALDHIKKAKALDPLFPPPHTMECWTALCLGRYDEAVAAARKAAELTEYASPRRAALGSALSAAGKTDEAEAIYESLVECRNRQYVSALDIAILAAYMERTDEAFDWLETAFQERAVWMNHLNADPLWDPIRDDSRFKLMAKKGGSDLIRTCEPWWSPLNLRPDLSATRLFFRPIDAIKS